MKKSDKFSPEVVRMVLEHLKESPSMSAGIESIASNIGCAFGFIANKGVVFLYGLCLCVTAQSAELAGRVVAIADGDTVTVLDDQRVQHKICLAGIDAPEKTQAFGNRSKESLSDCAFGISVVVHWDKLDRYQRKVGTVSSAGVDCNIRQLRLGMAWHYKKYAGEQPAAECSAYAATEEVARAAKAGLWSDSAPVAPWDFRAAARSQE